MPNPKPTLPRIATILTLSAGGVAQQRLDWLPLPLVLESLPGELSVLDDLDGDGDPDAIAIRGGGQLTDFTPMNNDGKGRFAPGVTTAFPSGSGPEVGYADLDGDGFGDLVVSSRNGGALGAGLLIYPGSGNGFFVGPILVPLPGNVADIEVGNCNGDGIADLCIRHFDTALSHNIRWIPGNVGRSFVPGPALTFPLATPIVESVVVDRDGDSIDDVGLVVDHNLGTDGIFLFRTLAAGFAAAGGLPLPGDYPTDAWTTDHDGDGDLDLVALSSPTGGSAVTLTLLRNDGAGAWAVPSSLTLPNRSAGRLHVGDWDGDGRQDLVLREYTGTAGLLRSIPGGYVVGPRLAMSEPGERHGAGLADLDGDRDLDFVDSKALLFGDGTFADPLNGNAVPVVVDWDRDGDLDTSGGSGVLLNDGRGHYTPLVTPPGGSTAPLGFAYLTGHGLVDRDGDGRHEGMFGLHQLSPFPWGTAVFVEMRWMQEDGAGRLFDMGPAAAPGVQVSAGMYDDVDNDGDFDLVTEQGVWLDNGAAFFAPPLTSLQGYRPVGIGDLDQDGDHDFVATKVTGGRGMAILRNQGGGNFVVEPLIPTFGSSITTTPALLVDLDDDGDLDVVALEQWSTSQFRTALFGNQGGVLSRVGTLPTFGTYGVGDVDGDGRTDLSIASEDTVRVLLRTGTAIAYGEALVYRIRNATGLADVDSDGDPDLLGQSLVRNRRIEMPDAGQRRQYGQGGPGLGERRPILSMTGPIRSGETPSIRLRNAAGGTFSLLVVSAAESNVPSVTFPGLTLYATPAVATIGMLLSGAPNQAGAGGMDLPLPIPPGFSGLRLYLQSLVFDSAAPNLIAHSGGVEFVVGR